MCHHDHKPKPLPHLGACLAHGHAHTRDHARWSRREFLAGLGIAAGGSMLLGGTPVQALGRPSMLARLQQLQTDRVLVLIQLNGGNDGLNTVIPIEDDRYYNLRPSLGIDKRDALAIGNDLGLHPSFEALLPGYNEGRMAVLQNVGYPDPVLSHFRSTDIWMSASDSEVVDTTGWAGRYLDQTYPNFIDTAPDHPLAVQVGGGAPMLFQGPAANMGMSLASVELFERIAESGTVYDVDNVPGSAVGDEMAFVRGVANDSFQYASVVQEASDAGSNQVDYPNANPLADNLSILARLIKGNLNARIYHVSLGSFDTHAGQANTHRRLLQDLSDAVAAFYDDLAADGLQDRVMIMTFSEFGRRVQENGSGGTDHGTAAPLFLFGEGVKGGLYGSNPDLDDLDLGGNLRYETDFRSVYATVLQDWFGMAVPDVTGVLGASFDTLGFVADPTTVGVAPSPMPQAFALAHNYPNPFNPATMIPFTLERTAQVRLNVYDVQGRRVRTLVDGVLPAGRHERRFEAGRLPSGAYVYRLQTPEGTVTRQMMLVR